MIKITKKTTINELNRFITKGVLDGKKVFEIMKKNDFLHTIYNSNRIDLIHELSVIYGKEVVNIVNDNGNNLLHLSVLVDASITAELIRIGVRIDIQNKAAVTPFHVMCITYDKFELEHVLNMVDDPKKLLTLRDGDNNTPLITAVKVGNVSIIETLLKYKPNLGVTNNNGDNVLFVAIKIQNHRIVELLLNTGYKFNQLHKEKLTPADVATIVPSSQIAALMEKHKISTYIRDDQIDIDDRCNICDYLMIDPVHLKCKHQYCMSCFLLANIDTTKDELLCPFRCNCDITRDTIRINNKKADKIRNNYSSDIINHRINLGYISKAYLILSKLGNVSDNMSVQLYRGGMEFLIRYIEKRIKITIKMGIWLPNVVNVQTNILKLLLDANNPPTNIGIGSLYMESDNMIYNDIDIPINHIKIDSLERLLDGVIIVVQTLVASINTFSNIVPININLPILPNIDSEFLRKPRLVDILEDLHGTSMTNSKLNTSIDVNISPDNCFVELSTLVGRIDINHTHTYKYLLSYRPPIFDKIHNARISVDKQSGMVNFLAIIIYGLSDSNTISGHYSTIEEASNTLQQAIKVNCRQQ
tara:strand:- start:2710 stop:4470 length:1761 start_codon:yes stop_codon:yes gene_type:complete